MKDWTAKCWESMSYFRMAWLRCMIYGGIVAWGAFLAGVEGYDTLSQLTDLQKIKLAGGCFVAFGGVLVAFLDTTMATLRNGRNQSPPAPEQPQQAS